MEGLFQHEKCDTRTYLVVLVSYTNANKFTMPWQLHGNGKTLKWNV